MTMTRKHFEAVAEGLAQALAQSHISLLTPEVERAADKMADHLVPFNGLFDRGRFVRRVVERYDWETAEEEMVEEVATA